MNDLWTIRNPPAWLLTLNLSIASSSAEAIVIRYAMRPEQRVFEIARLLPPLSPFYLNEPIRILTEYFRVDWDKHELVYQG